MCMDGEMSAWSTLRHALRWREERAVGGDQLGLAWFHRFSLQSTPWELKHNNSRTDTYLLAWWCVRGWRYRIIFLAHTSVRVNATADGQYNDRSIVTILLNPERRHNKHILWCCFFIVLRWAVLKYNMSNIFLNFWHHLIKHSLG